MSTGRIAASAFGLLVGCVTTPGIVGLRPDGSPGPEPCPKKALETMEILRLHPGDEQWIDLDMNKLGQLNITVNDGPIESSLSDALGPLETRTRLYGQVWTRGPDVVIRYYQAQPLDAGGPLAICAVARLGDGQLRKKPGPAPGSAILPFSEARVHIVDSFR
ncbi:MAG TPA: serine/threonine protein kinase [Myxococcales bacterium]|jgi:hypothetical protein|nr:serine/threonine protein kinase [Myxococcales bacterium]